eukprot:TRINITY_DN10261_c0_g1_i1.p1 TRINITY_DN10261_c0_g1~~TRINITY_DN10261_c0_g1_i1.p1  ORF type:complete len:610 (-),score=190.37 TRINITY_DN10261_c0_g1_i1:194-2023(-)
MDMSKCSVLAITLSLCVALASAVPVAVRPVGNTRVPNHGMPATPRTPLEPRQSLRIPKGWQQVAPAQGSEKVTLTFALKQQNKDKLDARFWAVSEPNQSNYGQYMSRSEVDDLVRPARGTIAAVTAWLSQHNVDTQRDCIHTTASDFIKCTMGVQTAETLLNTRFYHYVSTARRRSVLRAPFLYTVPSALAKHLDFIGGIHRFPSPLTFNHDPAYQARAQHRIKASDAQIMDEHNSKSLGPLRQRVTAAGGNADEALAFAVTPYLLRARYNVSMEVGSSSANSQSVAQFLGQYFSKLDLDEFFTIFDLGLKKTYKVTIIGPDSGFAGTEASLDIEYIMSMGANVSTTFWSTGGLHDNQEPFLEWITAVNNATSPPLVNSVSYGDDESTLDPAYMERVNTEFQKAGTKGLSILFASGDNGVGQNQAGDKFAPNFPATSPYVTAVGGTEYVSESSEVANYISSGGFSNQFARPSYQDAAVQKFLSTKNPPLPPQSYYNTTGRGFPDVAALSSGFIIVANLIPTPGVAGTSCAAPTFSGLVTLLNDIRLNAGKPALGFLNPFLYANGTKGLYDVTQGCNAGPVNNMGFCAVEGWDPVTGLGTPNFDVLKTIS